MEEERLTGSEVESQARAGILLVPNIDNYGVSRFCDRHSSVSDVPIKMMTVWGSSVFNCAESALSEVILRNKDSLSYFAYFPARTKGGTMLRPHYCRGDRNGLATFPVLTELAMPFEVILYKYSLKECNWVTPDLQKLTLLYSCPDTVGSKVHDFLDRRIHCMLYMENPTLREISICTGDFDRPNDISHRVSIKTPVTLPWEKKRLLFLVFMKESSAICTIARLAHRGSDMLRFIMEFLCCPWEVTMLDSL